MTRIFFSPVRIADYAEDTEDADFVFCTTGNAIKANARMAFAMIHTVDFTFSLRFLAQTGKFVLHFLLSELRRDTDFTDDAVYFYPAIQTIHMPKTGHTEH